jgi:hypothetical protein
MLIAAWRMGRKETMDFLSLCERTNNTKTCTDTCQRWSEVVSFIKVSWLTARKTLEKWAVAVGKLVLIDKDAANRFPAIAFFTSHPMRKQAEPLVALPSSGRFSHANSFSQRLSSKLPTVYHTVAIILSILPTFPTSLYTIYDHDYNPRLTHNTSAS